MVGLDRTFLKITGLAADCPLRRGDYELSLSDDLGGGLAFGEACYVRVLTTFASMPEVAARTGLGEPPDRSVHFRARITRSPCA